jgi:hypothetical protein
MREREVGERERGHRKGREQIRDKMVRNQEDR